MAFVPKYIFILFFLITVDYFLGKIIEKRVGKERKVFFIISILSNIGVLFFFKYFNFFNENVAALANFLHWNYSLTLLSIILPLGLSFHVFQSLSYVIEVYRGRYKAENNYLTYALYVMFFPQLMAGPIERPYNLLPQFREKHDFNYDRVVSGLQRMLWGFFKKIVIADNLALYVNQIYGQPHDYSGLVLLTATVFFFFQILCDFSGYTDIAIGGARILGFKLLENFNHSYFSRSIGEFWQRQHISLSTWFRDYLYFPLGGSRVSTHRWYFNIFTVFLLSGLWHGANWTFAIWGGLHGFYLIFGKITKNWRHQMTQVIGLSQWPRLHYFYQIMITFTLVSLSFVFFRANTSSDAFYIVIHSFLDVIGLIKGLMISIYQLNLYPFFEALKPLFERMGVDRSIILPIVAIYVVAEVIDFKRGLIATINSQQIWIRWLIYIAAVLAIMNLGVTFEAPFIYFQF